MLHKIILEECCCCLYLLSKGGNGLHHQIPLYSHKIGNLQLMNSVHSSSPVSLNVLACDSTFKIINTVLQKGVNIKKVWLISLLYSMKCQWI